jgi:hypothetical protein
MDIDGTHHLGIIGDEFPRDAMIIDSTIYPANETMHQINQEDGLYNHHAAVLNLKKRAKNWVGCEDGSSVPDLTPWAILLGSGNGEIIYPTTEETRKIKTGIYVGAKDVIFTSLDIVNYNVQERSLYIYTEVEYLPGNPSGYSSGEQRQIPMGSCDGSFLWKALDSVTIHAPAGQKKITLSGKKDLKITQDGLLRGICKSCSPT